MGRKTAARAINKAKELALETKNLREKLNNLADAINNQKLVYMNVIKMMVHRHGDLYDGEYVMSIPDDLEEMESWEMVTTPDEATHSLVMRLSRKEQA